MANTNPANIYIPQDIAPVTPPSNNQNNQSSISPKKFHIDKNFIAGVIAVFLLLTGVGAGLILLNQEQDIRSKAAVTDQGSVNNLSSCGSIDINPAAKSSCSSFCNNSGCTLPGGLANGRCEIRRFHSNDRGDSVVNDTQTGFTNNGGGNLGFIKSCGAEQIDVGCYTDELNHDGVYNDGFKTVAYAWTRYSESCGATSPAPPPPGPPGAPPPPPTGGVPQCGCYGSGECVDKPNNEGPTHPAGECIMDNDKGYCVWDPGRCSTGSNNPPPPPPPPGLCDDSCTQNSDCADHSPAGALLICNTTIKKCVNKLCPGDTMIGNNCDCKTPVQTCGQPCGGGYPLCGAGFACRFITGPNNCATSTSNPRAYCIPHPVPTGYSLPKCVSGDTGNSYIKRTSDGKSIWTAAEINKEFCQTATPAPTPVPTPPVAPITAQCVSITIYDENWNILTNQQFSQLSPGSLVRFAAGGSTTGGQIQAARFTINGNLRPEVSAKVPAKSEFYDEYTIPAGTTNFTIKGEIKHSTLGWF